MVYYVLNNIYSKYYVVSQFMYYYNHRYQCYSYCALIHCITECILHQLTFVLYIMVRNYFTDTVLSAT